jgi:hypothetical protein
MSKIKRGTIAQNEEGVLGIIEYKHNDLYCGTCLQSGVFDGQRYGMGAYWDSKDPIPVDYIDQPETRKGDT